MKNYSLKNESPLALETQLNNRYVIKSVLGRGGTSWVYLAHHRFLNKDFAIKELFPVSCCCRKSNQKCVQLCSVNDEERFWYFKKHIFKEAEILSRLNHPNILKIYDFFEENDTFYLVLESLKGCSLDEYIKIKGFVLTEKEIRILALNVLSALDYIHKNGIIHKDICSVNIFCEESGMIKLLDFGFSDSFFNQEDIFIAIRKGYSPPELYKKGESRGTWTDLYALGAIMYKAATGKEPPDSLERLNSDSLVPPNRINKKISFSLNMVILKALSLKQKARYQTAQDFIEDLGRLHFSKRLYVSYEIIISAIIFLSVMIAVCCMVLMVNK